MKKPLSLILILLMAQLASLPLIAQSTIPVTKPLQTQAISIKTVIEPGSELLTIMMWLAGKYAMPMDSKYKSEVWAAFSKYRNSPLLDRMKNSEMYPDFSEMGLLLTDFPAIRIETPPTNSWYERKGGKDNIVGLLNDARAFAAATGFWKFYQRHSADYVQMTTVFSAELTSKDVLPAVDNFFRYGDSKRRPEVTIYLEPLNNWGAHAIDFQRLRGEPNGARVTFQIGPSEQPVQLPDSPLVFAANRSTVQNVWHEASHIYVKNALAANKARIDGLTHLFNAPALASQNIKTWDYAFEENLVRSIVAVITKAKFGDDAYKREVAGQTQRGFIYVKDIAELLGARYVDAPAAYPTFDQIMPEILAALDAKPAMTTSTK